MDAIVVGTDGSRGAETAVQKVVELAGGSEATVHVVCAYPGRSALERVGLTARQEPLDLRGAAEQHADLVVVGAHGTPGRGRFLLGGVPAKLVHHMPTSVLIARAA